MTQLKDQSQLSYDQKVANQANTIVTRAVLVFFFAGILLAAFYNTWMVAFISGIALLGSYYLPKAFGTYNRYLNSTVLAAFTIQFHYQLHGIPASHFFFFVVLTILLFYEDWQVLLPAAILHIAFVSILFFKADLSIVQLFLKESGKITLGDYLLHLTIVGVYTLLCSLWSQLQHNQTMESATHTDEMQQQLNLVESNQQFAQHISQGNLRADYPSQNPDKLGQALLAMRSSLLESATREERERFMTVGLASIGEILRLHVNDLQMLCDNVLTEIVKYTKSNQGFFFTVEEAGTKDEHLKLRSARAWERKKFLEKRIEIGQGLIGQAVIEKSIIYMTDVPEEYVQITSGLGEANPRSIIVVPLKNEEQVIGVLELASFKKFEEHELKFLEKLGESIASTILNSRNNERNKILLDQSSELMEQMKAQEEVLRQNMEEMQATQEETERAQKMLAKQTEEAGKQQKNLYAIINATSDSVLALDKNYTILAMNNIQRKRYKGTQYEGIEIGANALEALGAVRNEWKGYYDRALAGEKVTFQLKSSVNGEDAWREYFIYPMEDETGEIFGATTVSRDVTSRYSTQQEIAKRGFIINAFTNLTTDTYFALDTNYSIIVANNTLKERFRIAGVDMKEGLSIKNVLPEESLKLWMPRYEKALAGEKIHLTEARQVGDKTLQIEVFVEPIFDDQQKIIGCAVMSRDITELHNARERLAKQESVNSN